MTRRPRVVIASRVYAPEGTAAAYRLEQLTKALVAAGYAPLVLTTRAPGASASTPSVRRWPVLRDRSGSVRGYVQYASFDIPLFFRLLTTRRPELVVVEPPPTTGLVTRLACFLRRIPYIYYSADVTSAAVKTIGAPSAVVRVVTAMERWVLRGARAILSVSAGVSAELETLGIDMKKVTVVGTGVDTAIYRPEGPDQPCDAPYFVYAGTMSEFQGSEVFVDAFLEVAGRHPTVRLKMFGGGVDVDKLKQRAASVADRVEFHGFVDSATVARHLRSAHAGLASVRPGLGYDFAIPTKALVSIACGTPLIFAGVGPIHELMQERHLGWAVDWSPAPVAEAMFSALTTPSTRLPHETISWLQDTYSLAAAAQRAAAVVTAHTQLIGADTGTAQGESQ